MRVRTNDQAEKILTSASELFAGQRFDRVRMEDVARAAEVGKGTLYRYFHDKQDLYVALLNRAASGLRRHTEAALAAAATPRAQLEAIVASILDYFDQHPYLLELLQHAEARQTSGALKNWQSIRAGNLRRVVEILEEGRAQGLWKVSHPEIPAMMLLGGLRGVLRFSQPPRAPDLPRRIVDDFLHGVSR